MALLLQPWEGGRDPNSINSPLSKDEHQDLSEVSPSSSTPPSTTISDDPSSIPTSTAVSSRAITTQPTDSHNGAHLLNAPPERLSVVEVASGSIAHISLAPLNPPSPSCSQPGHSSHALKHSHPDHVFSPLVNLSPALTPPRNDKQKQSHDINDPLHTVFSASTKSSGDEAMAILALSMLRGPDNVVLGKRRREDDVGGRKRRGDGAVAFEMLGDGDRVDEEEVGRWVEGILPMERLEESDVEADVIVGGDYGVAEAESVGLRDERVKRQTEMIATITRLINSEINQLAQSQATRDLDVRLESVRLATLVAQSKIQESRRVRATIKETARCATLLKARIEQTEKKIERIKSLKRGVVEKIFLEDATEILEEDERSVDKATR